jgi:hypothetical protein
VFRAAKANEHRRITAQKSKATKTADAEIHFNIGFFNGIGHKPTLSLSLP